MKSKITIDTIKSGAARFQIENYTTNDRMLSKAAISAVVKAEQDAEERFVKFLEDELRWLTINGGNADQLSVICRLLNKLTNPQPTAWQPSKEDAEQLNNGGQKDEK